MDRNEILQFLYDNEILVNNQYNSRTYRKFNSEDLQQNIFELTNNCEGTSVAERIYWLVHNLYDYPKSCPNCSNKIKNWRSWDETYRGNFCSRQCSSNDTNVKNKRINTLVEKYPSSDEEKKFSYNEAKGIDYFTILNDPELFIKYWFQYGRLAMGEMLGVAVEEIKSYEQKYDVLNIYKLCLENEMADIVQEFGLDIIRNSRSIIKPLELDVYIPSKRIAIDIDELINHSEREGNKDKFYHINKTDLANEQGITLIHIYDSEFTEKYDVIKQKIKSQLDAGYIISSDSCDVVEMSRYESDAFLQLTSIDNDKSSISYGLMYNGSIISAIDFSKSPQDKNFQWQIVRFSSIGDIKVDGGFLKIFNTFVNDHSPISIMYGHDLRNYSTNEAISLGFEFIYRKEPDFFLTNDYRTKTDDEFADKIWNCGTDVYLWKTR